VGVRFPIFHLIFSVSSDVFTSFGFY
jgi:hypothetical protein